MTELTQGSDKALNPDKQSIKQQILNQKRKEYHDKWIEALCLLGGKRSKNHRMGGLRFYIEVKA